MATIEENKQSWGVNYEWDKQGDEWSSAWGGPEAQWFGTIFPRIHSFIPASSVLEIAPGYGRWTNYLKDHCTCLVCVDLAEKCIKACKQRFVSDSHITFYVNDGKSLSMIKNKSVDFVFSFDSLVHADPEIIEVYLNQLAEKLTDNGIGFIHHSNMGVYKFF